MSKGGKDDLHRPTPNPREAMPGRWIRRIAAAAVGLITGLGLAELGLRLWAGDNADAWLHASGATPPPGFLVTAKGIGVVPAANFDGHTVTGVRLKTDANGIRVDPKATVRHSSAWLVLGDSFTEAAQVEAHEAFPARLSARTGVEFLNAGVDGYSTWQAVIRGQGLLQKTNIQGIVLVFYTGNDFAQNREWHTTSQRYATVQSGTPFPVGTAAIPFAPQVASTLLYNALLGVRLAYLGAVPGPQSTPAQEARLFHSSGTRALNESLRSTRAALAKLHQVADQQGIPVMLAAAPPPYVVRPDKADALFERYQVPDGTPKLDRPQNRVLELARSEGLRTCDLTPDLRAADAAGHQPYLIFEGHWSPKGHAVVAESLANCFVKEQLLHPSHAAAL